MSVVELEPFDQDAQAVTTKPRCLLKKKKRVPITLGLVNGHSVDFFANATPLGGSLPN